jgi:16S rRNA (adenine1518-N6/adenine1519-N6)-dimethyltransferase
LETTLELPEKTLVVGNLPYYITSPLLRMFFEGNGILQSHVVGGLFMVQEEVGEKIRYDAKKKSYLYWLLNYAYQVEYLKTVPAKAFNPPPNVKSCMISLVKKAHFPQISFDCLVAFLDAFAPYSRKTLGKIAKMLTKRGIFFSIPETYSTRRLEELGREDLEIILKA